MSKQRICLVGMELAILDNDCCFFQSSCMRHRRGASWKTECWKHCKTTKQGLASFLLSFGFCSSSVGSNQFFVWLFVDQVGLDQCFSTFFDHARLVMSEVQRWPRIRSRGRILRFLSDPESLSIIDSSRSALYRCHCLSTNIAEFRLNRWLPGLEQNVRSGSWF